MALFYGIVLQLLLLYACTLCNCALVAPPPLPGRGTAAELQVGFYSRTCPRAEDIVRTQVQKRFLLDPSITPALLRMLFHDSFVRGTDASILLNSKPGHEAEKEALPNLTIRGFDLIDEAKDAVEAACPGVVSCADILVLAVRDSVALAGGPKYAVPTGRLDGKVSIKEEALSLPSPAFPVEQSQESFRQKGLDLEDMVALLGAHTVGVALCGFFNDRLFNFRGTGMADPTMNPQLVTRLSTICPNPFFTESNADPPIDLDQSTPALFDTAYYTQILAGNGILQIDQAITADPTTLGFVNSFTSASTFFPAFVKSIIKMGNVDVITADTTHGEIRLKCNVSNSRAAARAPVPATKPGPAPGTKRGPAPGTKPGPATKPGPGPATKPGPGPATKPGPVTAPVPGTKPGSAAPKPAAPVTGRPAPVTKPSPAGQGKPSPVGHVSKPPARAKPTPVSKRPATAKPPAGSKPRKPPPRQVAPVTMPAPRGRSPVPKPPFGPPPVTPAAPGHGRKPPVGHVSRPSPPQAGHVGASQL
ncbi:hypothetical protein GOP47_0013597 [Adiantum capillus-veneris]|uniref:peroxidase n=1 Tax=Adiantum capillus-veneris TaxID=13818 RepID=A0A9D4UP12_ADICA|nr:hypothetical protein GOP47_0013597 [Adiantum capillus-veneris]